MLDSYLLCPLRQNTVFILQIFLTIQSPKYIYIYICDNLGISAHKYIQSSCNLWNKTYILMNYIHRSWLVESKQVLRNIWKLISLPSSLDFIFKIHFLNFALFPLNSLCLARICSEHCLEICITSTSCVCLPLYNVSPIVFLNVSRFG